jgi:hypothetical protein
MHSTRFFEGTVPMYAGPVLEEVDVAALERDGVLRTEAIEAFRKILLAAGFFERSSGSGYGTHHRDVLRAFGQVYESAALTAELRGPRLRNILS